MMIHLARDCVVNNNAQRLTQLLLAAPALVAERDEEGQTLLHYLAARDGYLETQVPGVLLWQSPRVNWQQENQAGLTPLHIVALNERRDPHDVVRLFLFSQGRFNVNTLTNDGNHNSLFDIALDHEQWTFMALLLNYGANPALTGAMPDLLAYLDNRIETLTAEVARATGEELRLRTEHLAFAPVINGVCQALRQPESAHAAGVTMRHLLLAMQNHHLCWSEAILYLNAKKGGLNDLTVLMWRLDPIPLSPLTASNLVFLASQQQPFNGQPQDAVLPVLNMLADLTPSRPTDPRSKWLA